MRRKKVVIKKVKQEESLSPLSDAPVRRKKKIVVKKAAPLPEKKKTEVPVKETKKTPAPKKKKKKASKKEEPKKETAPLVKTSSKTKEDASTARFKALLPDIEGLTEKIIEADLDHTQAIEVTTKADDLVDWAPNVLAWCADKRFLGMRPFAKQAEIMINLFEEWCPQCSEPGYVKNIPIDASVEQIMTKVALLDFGKCPHCGFKKGTGRKDGTFVDPLELIAVIGQRAGKSAVASMVVSYLVHRNLMLPVPWKSYGLTPGQIIDFTFVATTAAQSEKTLWATFKGVFTGSAWFKAYKEVCDTEGRKQGIKTTVKSLDTYINFGHKNMLIYFAANNPASLRGTTRFGAAIDELGWFDGESGTGKVRANGPETYAALNNACLTLRASFAKEVEQNPNCNWPVPLMANISSPRSMDDAIMTIYRDSAKNKRVIRRNWATWEMNPYLPKKLLIDTGDLKKPTGMRDYGAVPPLADDPLVQRIDIVTEAFKSPLATESRYGPIIRPYALGYVDEMEVASGIRSTRFITAGLQEDVPQIDLEALRSMKESDLADLGPTKDLLDDLIAKPPHKRMHVMGVDLGTTNNALAVVCGFLALDNSKFITDFILEIQPKKNLPINIAHVYENLIVPLVEKMNVVAVFYDRWSSLHQIQDLASRYGSLGPLNDGHERRKWLRQLAKNNSRPAFIADQYSLNMADALMLVARMEQGDCLFPSMETDFMELMVNKSIDPIDYPFTHLAVQFATVRAKGARLLKPVNRDDDIFRAWTNCAVPAFSNELVIDLLSQEVRAEPMAKKASASQFHVSIGQAGRGVRQAGNIGSGAVSTGGTNDFPVIVRKGLFRG